MRRVWWVPWIKEGKKIWVLCSAARAVENEIARASKNKRPGEALLAFFEGGANITGRPARNVQRSAV